MLKYSGPKTKRLDISEGDGFTKRGRTEYIEERPIFVEQTYVIDQVLQDRFVENPIDHVYYEEDEKEIVAPSEGTVVPLSHEHTVDRLALNQTLQNVRFKPDGSFNSVLIENEVETRLAPLLTADRIFKNVTRDPQLKANLTQNVNNLDTEKTTSIKSLDKLKKEKKGKTIPKY